MTQEESETKSNRLEVLLEDFRRIRNEIASFQSAQRRMVRYVIVAFGIGLPVLVNNVGSEAIVTAVLFGFAFACEFLSLTYVGLTRGILRLSGYELREIVPRINEITDSPDDLLKWEQYMYDKVRGSLTELIGYVTIALGEIALIAGPSILCIFIAFLVSSSETRSSAYFWAAFVVYIILFLLLIFVACDTISQSRTTPSKTEAQDEVL